MIQIGDRFSAGVRFYLCLTYAAHLFDNFRDVAAGLIYPIDMFCQLFRNVLAESHHLDTAQKRHQWLIQFVGSCPGHLQQYLEPFVFDNRFLLRDDLAVRLLQLVDTGFQFILGPPQFDFGPFLGSDVEQDPHKPLLKTVDLLEARQKTDHVQKPAIDAWNCKFTCLGGSALKQSLIHVMESVRKLLWKQCMCMTTDNIPFGSPHKGFKGLIAAGEKSAAVLEEERVGHGIDEDFQKGVILLLLLPPAHLIDGMRNGPRQQIAGQSAFDEVIGGTRFHGLYRDLFVALARQQNHRKSIGFLLLIQF